ncbi:Gp49 family protein [Aeromonas hydrophila]|uniref:Gp49 family protein n=1 Tax=Aeromonas hydrophila TaxID=644 RepID=UPI003D1D16E4
MSDQQIEQEILAKGLTAPRVTPQRINDVIVSEQYFTAAQGMAGVVDGCMVDRFLTWPVPASVYPDGAPGKEGRTGTNLLSCIEARQMLDHVVAAPVPASFALLTFCVLELKNGFTVTGESACASPENFDAEIGRKIARENAVNKVWMLEGYLLKQQLHDQGAVKVLTDADALADLSGTPRPDNPAVAS